MQEPSRPATGYPYPNPNPNPNPTQPPPPNCYPNYPPPPQAAYPYQNPYYASPQQTARATFIRRLIILGFAVLILIAIVFLILTLVLRPRLPDFRIDSLSVSNFNATAATNLVTGTWNIGFQVTNPNKKASLRYDNVVCSVSHGSYLLSENRLPPFYQPSKEQRIVNASLSVAGTYVDKGVIDSMNFDRSTSDGVAFAVRVAARLGYRYGSWRGRSRWLSVYCGGVSVRVSSGGTGKMVGGGRQCRVG